MDNWISSKRSCMKLQLLPSATAVTRILVTAVTSNSSDDNMAFASVMVGYMPYYHSSITYQQRTK